MKLPPCCAAFVGASSICPPFGNAADPQGPVLKVPDGFSIELVAEPPLVERPIVAAFDDEGRLYVAESSGSNDPVEKQLEERLHRVVRLEDADGDGRFDRRTVFANRMMFPEGTMFLDGSLYVSPPPSIWKLTDTDGDGVADERVEWFQGKTSRATPTTCTDLILGSTADLLVRSAFAEQTHTVNEREWEESRGSYFSPTGWNSAWSRCSPAAWTILLTLRSRRMVSGLPSTFLAVQPRGQMAHTPFTEACMAKTTACCQDTRTGELMPTLVAMSRGRSLRLGAVRVGRLQRGISR